MCQGPVVRRAFHVQAGPERCLPVDSHTSRSSKVPQLQLEGQPLPVHGSTVWASHSPTSFHKSHETCFGKRFENGGLSGRFVDRWQMQGRDRTSLPVDKEATGIPRLCREHGEVPLQSNPENRISGVHHRFRDNDLRAPQSEDKGNQARMQKALAGTTGDSTSDYTHNRGLSCNSHCNHSSTTALYRALQWLKNRSLSFHHSYEWKVTLDQESRQDLTWWIGHLGTNNGRPIHQPVPDLEIESDASNGGWGACCNGL